MRTQEVKEEATEENIHLTHARSLIMYIYPYLDPTPLRRRFTGSRMSAHLRTIVRHRLHPTTIRISWSARSSNPQTRNPTFGPQLYKSKPFQSRSVIQIGTRFYFIRIYFFYVVLTSSLSLPVPPPRWWSPSLPSSSSSAHLHAITTSLHTARSDHPGTTVL